MMYLRAALGEYRAPVFAYHSQYLAVATALLPRMAVLCPLMQINRRQRAIEDMNPKSWRPPFWYLRSRPDDDPGSRYWYQSFVSRYEFRLVHRQHRFGH
jgi:hypothetical protein